MCQVLLQQLIVWRYSVGLTQIGSALTRCNSCLHLPLSHSALLGSVNVQDIVLHLLRSLYCWPNCYAVVWSLDLHQVRLWCQSMTSRASHQRKCGSLLSREVNCLMLSLAQPVMSLKLPSFMLYLRFVHSSAFACQMLVFFLYGRLCLLILKVHCEHYISHNMILSAICHKLHMLSCCLHIHTQFNFLFVECYLWFQFLYNSLSVLTLKHTVNVNTL